MDGNNFNKQTDTSATGTTTQQYALYYGCCANRLPCGVCRLTNAKCPLAWDYPSITWNSGSVTCKYDGTATAWNSEGEK